MEGKNNKNLGEMDTLTQKCAACQREVKNYQVKMKTALGCNWLYFFKSVRFVPSRCKTASVKAPCAESTAAAYQVSQHRVQCLHF